jgi:hypothetical protein
MTSEEWEVCSRFLRAYAEIIESGDWSRERVLRCDLYVWIIDNVGKIPDLTSQDCLGASVSHTHSVTRCVESGRVLAAKITWIFGALEANRYAIKSFYLEVSFSPEKVTSTIAANVDK